VFVYPKDKDSVLLVEPADYNACNTSSYDKRFDDGSTSFSLDTAGAFFFISGVEANCRAGEKLIVMVAGGGPAPAPQGGSSSSSSSSTPAPSGGGGAAKAPPSTSSSSSPKNSTAKGAPHAGGSGDKNGAGGLTISGFLASFVGGVAYATLAF
jgi:hypothetical protein